MDNLHSKIKKLLFISPLSPQDREEFFSALRNLGEDDLELLCGVFERYPTYFVPFFYGLYRAKKKALEGKDAEAMKKILQEEKEALEYFEQNLKGPDESPISQ